jgi:hypothetical protein
VPSKRWFLCKHAACIKYRSHTVQTTTLRPSALGSDTGGVILVDAPMPSVAFDWTTGCNRVVNSGVLITAEMGTGACLRVWKSNTNGAGKLLRTVRFNNTHRQRPHRLTSAAVFTADVTARMSSNATPTTLRPPPTMALFANQGGRVFTSVLGDAVSQSPSSSSSSSSSEREVLLTNCQMLDPAAQHTSAVTNVRICLLNAPMEYTHVTSSSSSSSSSASSSSSTSITAVTDFIGVSSSYDHTVKVWDLRTGETCV